MPPVRRDMAVGIKREAGGSVPQLGELDLQLAFARAGMLGKDVEDELSAVEHLELGLLCDVAQLRGGQFAVEHQHLDAEVHRSHDEVLQLALPDHGAPVELAAPLQAPGRRPSRPAVSASRPSSRSPRLAFTASPVVVTAMRMARSRPSTACS